MDSSFSPLDLYILCLVVSVLCDLVDCSPSGSSVHDSPGKNAVVGCRFFLQGIFPTQGLIQVSHIAGEFSTI